jgi:hypothetical protein
MQVTELIEMVRDYWADTDRSMEQTLDDLRELVSETEMLIEATENDIRNKNEDEQGVP